MKYILNKTSMPAIFILSLFSFVFAPFAYGADTHNMTRMVCRSGGNMSVIVSPSVNTKETWLQIRFIRSRFSLNNLRPRAGECTFLQRTISSDEPDILATHLRARIWTQFDAVGTGHTNAGVVPGDMYKEDQKMAKEILDIVRSEGFFTVEVYNTNEGYFKIVSINQGIQ